MTYETIDIVEVAGVWGWRGDAAMRMHHHAWQGPIYDGLAGLLVLSICAGSNIIDTVKCYASAGALKQHSSAHTSVPQASP